MFDQMNPDRAYLFFIIYPAIGVAGYLIGFLLFFQRPDLVPFWIMYVFAGFLISVYYLDRRSDGVLEPKETWIASIVPLMSFITLLLGTYYTLYLYRVNDRDPIDY